MPATVSVRDAAAPPATARQLVRFAFYAVDPTWRRRSAEERAADRAEVAQVIRETAALPGVVLRTYSQVGTRGDADFMVWLISEDMAVLHGFSRRLNGTRLGGWLRSPHSYLAMTKRSTYTDAHRHPEQEGRGNRLVITPGGRRYLFVYPFVKTRSWYRLDQHERQRQMNEHIAMGHRHPSVKINTTYSFGIDDQEFVVAFETDFVGDFLDLMMTLRETEASRYTERDTPIFTCRSGGIREVLDTLGAAAATAPVDA